MATPFTRRFSGSDLILKTRAENLSWISLATILVMGIVTVLVLLNKGYQTALVTGLLTLSFLGVLVLLAFGKYHWAANTAFAFVLLGSVASAIINRTGVLDSDLYMTITFFSLAVFLVSSIGYSGILGLVMTGTGLLTMAWFVFVPAPPELLAQTVTDLNNNSTPWIIVLLFALGGAIGTFNLYQMGGILRTIRQDKEIIETNNFFLEQTVNQRTAALKNILDNTGQGFFTFENNWAIHEDYSRGCVKIFKKEIVGLNPVDLLFPKGSEAADEFVQGCTLYFAGKSKASVIFDLLEKSAYIQGRYINIDYKEAGQGVILVILTDVTTERLLEQKNQEEESRRLLLVKALGNKHYFAGFLREADSLFALLETYWSKDVTDEDKQTLMREIHTFKGNCGFFGFTQTMENAHDFETNLSDSLVLGGEVPYQDFYFDLKKSYYLELKTISDTLGKSFLEEAGGIIVPRQYYLKMLNYIKDKHGGEQRFLHYMEHFTKIDLRDLFSRFAFIAQSSAEKLGKKIRPMKIEVDELRVSPERFERLAEACVHIVNNMVDHGIEPAYERENSGKPAEGNLSLKATEDHGALTITFADDGRGIDPEAVLKSARAKGLVPEDRNPAVREIYQLLFADGFSTRTEVTETSGRGVGLAAVREAVSELGGRIEIESRKGFGTTFELVIPLRRRGERNEG